MTLTGLPTLFVAIAISLSFFLFILLFWKKLFKPGFKNFFFRASILIIANVIMIATIGIGFNRSQGFFSSWRDLFGNSQDFSGHTVSYASFVSPNTLKKGKLLKGGYVLLTETIEGKNSRVSNQVTVLLPPQAILDIKRGNSLANGNFRVVEFLTGFPSQPIMWFQALDLLKFITHHNNTNSQQIIGVIPQVNIEGKYDLECMNLPGEHPQAETWLTDDMHDYISQRFGINNHQWALMGVSTGGWCASMFAIKRPDLYRGAVSIAGYYRPALPLTDPIDLQKAMTLKYDLANFEGQLTNKVPLYLFASVGDVYSIRETRRFLAKPHPNLAIDYVEKNLGGHNSRVWRSAISGGLKWISQL